jgi:hypothetical protein
MITLTLKLWALFLLAMILPHENGAWRWPAFIAFMAVLLHVLYADLRERN